MTKPHKITKAQQVILDLIKNDYRVMPSKYLGRFGTFPARAYRSNDAQPEAPRISQNSIEALLNAGLVRYATIDNERRVVLAKKV